MALFGSKIQSRFQRLFDRWPKVKIPGRSEQKIIVNKVDVRPIHRESQDIQKWRNALVYAESEYQQRTKLYDMYSDVLLDGFLTAVVQKRIDSILNRDLTFSVDGVAVEEVTNLLDKTFFEEFLKNVMGAIFWGHSLMELYWPAPGSEDTGKTLLVPRKHVKPRLGVVTKSQFDVEGIAYREPPYKEVIIEAGGDEDLGLILQAAQYVIYKRGNFGDWAEYAEVFGMPFRWATYNNEQSRQVLESALEAAGSAGFVVAPADANLQFLQANTQAGTEVFEKLRAACNEEIAITILGNTMTTTEARNSGYAQSKTHQEVQDELHKADRRHVLRILNEKLTPYLARLGYPVQGGRWDFVEEETLSLKERLEIDMQVASKVPIANDYWYEKYKIPKPEEGDDVSDDDDEEDEPGEAPQKKKARRG